jgi:curved DNA-binding protein CbpA
MKWAFFVKDYASMEELRSHYRELCFLYHPDKHPEDKAKYTALFQKMANEYDEFLKDFIPGENRKESKKSEQYRREYNFDSESALGKVIADLMQYPGLVIEICGSWIWLTGDTFRHKDNIKKMGFRWQDKKKSWYFAGYDFKPKKSKIMDMDHIRQRYGSLEIETGEPLLIN